LIQVVCLSLAEQRDRRAYMHAQLLASGLSFRFFDALKVDLTEGFPSLYDRSQRMRHSGVDMRAGEMGCYLSHRQIWRELIAGDEQMCLVVEDDVEILPDFARVVQALCDTPERWEFVRLFGVFTKPAFPVMALTDRHDLVDYLEQPNGTQGYLINRAAAQRLLRYTDAMAYAIDMAIDREWEHGVRIMGVEPAVVAHHEAFETTLGTWHKLHLPLHKKLAREYFRAGSNIRKQLWLFRKRQTLRTAKNQLPRPKNQAPTDR
jgi:glycosyl transferase family 25